MARSEIPLTVLNQTTGQPSGGTVSITIRGGGPATVYTTETGGSIVSQPITIGPSGSVDGWLDRGSYTATITPTTGGSYVVEFESTPGGDNTIDGAWISPLSITAAKVADATLTHAKFSTSIVRNFNITSGVANQALGTFDGENITGIRVSGSLRSAGTGSNPLLYLIVNGLGSISVSCGTQRMVRSAGTTTADILIYQGNAGALGGLIIASCDWATTANDIAFDGTFFTKSGKLRHYLGSYSNQDIISNSNNYVSGRLHSIWHDGATALSSLSLQIQSGTFTGRVTCEVVP